MKKLLLKFGYISINDLQKAGQAYNKEKFDRGVRLVISLDLLKEADKKKAVFDSITEVNKGTGALDFVNKLIKGRI